MNARPDPDALLRRVEAEERKRKRGRFTIFFGAAPGVGKTFAMLQAGGILQDVEQRDVVVGLVETHGRFETATLLAGFERLPRRRVAYGGTVLEEFDLDGTLARKPSIVLLDELAHTNAPGSRHAKRWQDAEELLEAGIEVYSTLNVQHVESLNDVVAQITGVVVRETVPDAVIDSADDIKLVDLPPDDLLERLREGKVYLPAQASKALDNFFQKGNLLALRELALRKTAERVDADMHEWRRLHGIEKTWAATDRLLVCVGASPYSANLLRVGKRVASSLRARWFAVNVETPATLRLGAPARALLSQNLHFGEQLGAETVTLSGDRAADAILRFARERNVTKIIVGKPRHVRFRDRFTTSFVDQLLLGSGDIDIYATVGEAEEGAAPVSVTPIPRRPEGRAGYIAACGTTAVSTVATLLVFGREHPADVVMTYLLGVVIVATRFGYRASMVSGVLAVLAFDFFFVPPYLAFDVSDLRHIVTFAVMLLVAGVIATLTQRVRDQAEVARQSEQRTAVLYAMSRELAHTDGPAALARVAVRHVQQVFDAKVAILALGETYATEGFEAPIDKDQGVVQWVTTHKKQAGPGTGTLSGSRGFYAPLATFGVLGIFADDAKRWADPEQRRLVDAFATQIGMALERASLTERAEHARLEVETERLRSTLLSSISHDLRTPLAVMRGSASTLLDDGERMSASSRTELVSALLEETDRLDRQIRNLLEMTRLESGAVQLQREWQSVEEVVGAAWSRVEARLAGRNVTIEVPPDLSASFDAVLVEQVLVNFLENAAKYTPDGTPISVTARSEDADLVLSVSDRGPGIAEEERERIWEKFHRGPNAGKAGVGLGLAICRAIAAAHGGRTWALAREGGGAIFCLSIPIGAP